MAENRHSELDPVETSRLVGEKRPAENVQTTTEEERHPAEKFPPFDDPAFSARSARGAVRNDAPDLPSPPEDTRYAGHPDFSQDAAGNQPPPSGSGNSEPVEDANEKTRHSDGQNPPVPLERNPAIEQVSGAGPAIAERSKDAKVSATGRQPAAYVREDDNERGEPSD